MFYSSLFLFLLPSKYEHNPWLHIQLLAPTSVTSLSIINRKDCCGGRFKNIEVRVEISPNTSTNELIGWITGPGVTGDIHVLRFPTTFFVQYIKFQLIGGPGWLTINGVRLNRQPALDRTFSYVVMLDLNIIIWEWRAMKPQDSVLC